MVTTSRGAILVVDDEPTIAEVVGRYLDRAGYSTRSVGDGKQALELARAEPPDLVVLDLMLPGIGGLELLRRLRERVPVVILTAKDHPSERITGLHLGADDYVVKPFSPAELVARVDAVLRRARPQPGRDIGVVRDGVAAVGQGARDVRLEPRAADEVAELAEAGKAPARVRRGRAGRVRGRLRAARGCERHSPEVQSAFRAGLGARFVFLSDAERRWLGPLGLLEAEDTVHHPYRPTVLTLFPDLTVHAVYRGDWFWGRATNGGAAPGHAGDHGGGAGGVSAAAAPSFRWLWFDGERLSLDPEAGGRRFGADPRPFDVEPVRGAWAHVCAVPDDEGARIPYDQPEIQLARADALAWWIPLLGDSLVCLTTLSLDAVHYGGAITVARDRDRFRADPFARLFPGAGDPHRSLRRCAAPAGAGGRALCGGAVASGELREAERWRGSELTGAGDAWV